MPMRYVVLDHLINMDTNIKTRQPTTPCSKNMQGMQREKQLHSSFDMADHHYLLSVPEYYKDIYTIIYRTNHSAVKSQDHIASAEAN